MNINITNISNNIRMKANLNTSRVFSSKTPQMRPEEGKGFYNPSPLRQKSSSQAQILGDIGKTEDFLHCNRIKIREWMLNEMQNECQSNCRNLEKTKCLEKQIKDLLEANVYLKKINEYLIKSLTRKEELFLNVTNENKNLKFDNQLLNSHLGSKSTFSREKNNSHRKKSASCVWTSKNNHGNFNTLNNFFETNNMQFNSNSGKGNFNNNLELEEIIKKMKNEEHFESTAINSNNNYKVIENNSEKNLDKEALGRSKNRNSVMSDINISEINNNFTNKNVFYVTSNANNNSNKLRNFNDLKDFSKVKYVIDVENKESDAIDPLFNCNHNIANKKNETLRNKKSLSHNLLNLANEEAFGDQSKENYWKISSSNLNLMPMEFTHLNEKIKKSSNTLRNNNAKQPEVSGENQTQNLDVNGFYEIKNAKNSKIKKEENTFLKSNNGFLSAKNGSSGFNQLNSPLALEAGNPRKTLVIQPPSQKHKNYYEKISGMMRKSRVENSNKTKEENLITFLALERTNIDKVLNGRMFRKIKKLTHNENGFFEKLKSYDEEKLSGYFDMIASVSNNLQNAVNLFLKIKTVFNEILFTPRIETKENLCAHFVSLLTEIFECEKVLIYKSDESSDKVIISAGKEEDPLNDLRINKGFGIIGQVLEKGEATRIDDAALDPLFLKDRNNEHLKAMKIKNLLCAPVKVFYETKYEGVKSNNNSNSSLVNNSVNKPNQHLTGNYICSGNLTAKTNLNSNSNNNHKDNGIVNGSSLSFRNPAANGTGLLKTINGDNSNKALDTVKSNDAKRTEAINTTKNKANAIVENVNKKAMENKTKDLIESNLNKNKNNYNFKTIGVVQVINKKKGNFSNDDQELLALISSFFSLLWENISKSEFDSHQNSKLKIFCEFSGDRKLIKAKSDITALFESLLISMFSGNCAQLLFFDSEKDELRRITKYENKIKNKNVGIIGFVLDKKDYYGCESIIDCRHFSNLIDLETTCSLLTYPIFCNQKLIAVLQLGYNGKLCEGNKPQDCDQLLINNVIKSIVSWVCFVTENEIVEKENK